MPGALRQTAILMQRIQQPLLRQLAILIQPTQNLFIRVETQRFAERQVAAFPVASERRKIMRRRDCH